MTSKKANIIILMVLLCGMAHAQSTEASRRNRSVTRKTADQVTQVDNTVKETNDNIDKTVEGLDNTIDGAKETVQKVGNILFGSKKNKTKNSISITIESVTYGNESVESLYNELAKKNGSKKTSKTFTDGVVTIQIESKQNADAIWQEISKKAREGFKVIAMGEKNISVALTKETE